MSRRGSVVGMAFVLAGLVGVFLLLPRIASGHCDTLDGPVVLTAKAALEKGDVTPVLKWVKREQEDEIRAAFKKTLAVRAKGADAMELADVYFFETLVRIHRAGEGAPYAGLKPAGAVEPIVAAADKALEMGSGEHLVKEVTDKAAAGIRERYTKVLEKKKQADRSVEAGREFVEAYVDYVHYVERLHLDAARGAGHGGEPEEAEAHGAHAH